MEDLHKLSNLFPLNPDSPINEYLNYHYKSLSDCVKHKLYSSSFYHLHLIYMTLIYIQIERILNNISDKDRRLALIGFAKEENKLYIQESKKQPDKIIRASQLSLLNERDVFQFFQIVTDNNETIEEMCKLVYYRHKIFHVQPSMKIFDNEKLFIQRFEKYNNSLEIIIKEEIKFLEKLYKSILPLFEESTLTEDDLSKEFGIFSIHELKVLAKRNKDATSKQILNMICPE